MKLSCGIIKDLLPLYAEEMTGSESTAAVEEHLKECESCRNGLQQIQKSGMIPPDTDVRPLKEFIRNLRIEIVRTGVFATLLTLLAAVLVMVYITAPNYLPYSAETLTLSEDGTGRVTAAFGGEVTGYDLFRSEADPDTEKWEYTITAYNSILERNIFGRKARDAVLNPGGEEIGAVYYYTTDGSEDRLIFGSDTDPSGGRITLPRLALSYYLLSVLLASFVLFAVLLLARRHEKTRRILCRILLLLVSYCIGHLLVMGAGSSTYSLLRDFAGILITMIPVYFILLFIVRLAGKRNRAESLHR